MTRFPAVTAMMGDMASTPTELMRELTLPLRRPAVAAALLFFYLLLRLIVGILSLGPIFLVSALIIASFAGPALCLYLLDILDSRARGVAPEPPSVDHLQWFGSMWSLAQILHLCVLIYATWLAQNLAGATAVLAVDVLLALLLPASLAILALTHSPIESFNPLAIVRLIRRTGPAYWAGPGWLIASGIVVWWLWTLGRPGWVLEAAVLYALFAFYALTGGIIRPHKLHAEVDIHAPVVADPAKTSAALRKVRQNALDHAYAFISRGNRAGGLRHIEECIESDADPQAAWAWFFQQMLRWEAREPALFFGQRYLGWLLEHGEDVAAIKVLLRCRLEDETFRPLPEHRALALAAAERCQHDELVSLLR